MFFAIRHGQRSRVAGFALAVSVCVFLPPGAMAAPSPKPFEIVPGSFTVTPSSLQAGGHGDLTIGFDFKHSAAGPTFNDVRTTAVELPAGFAGAATAAPACDQAQFFSGGAAPECPPDTQVGTMSFEAFFGSALTRVTLPLYNMALTGPGLPAELGFRVFEDAQLMPLTIRSDGGLRLTTPDIGTTGEPRSISVTIWGVPAAANHDAERGRLCLPASLESPEVNCSGGGESAESPPKPLLANPTECGEPLVASMEAYSWEAPESPSRATAEVGPFAECERLPFDPTIEGAPTTDAAESSSGFDLSLALPQGLGWTEPESRTTSALAGVSVKLPEGLALNPAGAGGMLACTLVQLRRETAASRSPEGCPEASELGTAAIETPLLGEPLAGPVYLGPASIGPDGGLAAGLYAVAREPAAGVLVELRGRLQADPASGRLSAVFSEVPPMPFSRLELRFRSGQLAPLATPPACGSYAVSAELTPTSSPGSPRPSSDSFAISRGAGGGACGPPGEPPFGPGLLAGTLNNAAGGYSSFDLRLSREDGEARLGDFAAGLPLGLGARLAGVAECPQGAIEAARAQSGAEAQANPSCPAASQVGTADAGLGAGSSPFYAPGQVYLAGPHAGAPLSLAVIVPALAGPFDLGVAVSRAALFVDPETARLTLRSDAFPSILGGVPLDLRDLRIRLDRPGFIRNPTSCEPTQITTTASSSQGAIAELAVPFQVADCAALPFKPRLSLLLSNGARNGHPALRAVLRSGADQAGIAAATFTLPAGELLDLHHVPTLCARELPPGRCPPASRIGYARVWSPLLEDPLEGPIYLREPSHRFPDLLADLRSAQLHFLLHAHVAAPGGRLRVRFPALPDIPLSRALVTLAGGRRGILANSEAFCGRRARARAAFGAHSGKRRLLRPRLRCAP